jgi:hypothetical protein
VVLRKSIRGYTRSRMQNPTIKLIEEFINDVASGNGK